MPASSLKPLKQGPRVSQLIEEAERIASVSMANKSADQLRKWRAPKETAVAVFRKTIDGDPLLSELTVTDVHPFRDHWQNRILADEVKVNTANRMMKHVSGLYANIANHYHFEARNPFHGILFKNADDASRPPYDTDYIQAQFLAEGMFEDLNPEARRVIYLMIETGVRPSEACGLHRRAIHLDAPIPYISVTTETRDTKTRGSVRDIPLVGAALMAMKLQRDGFPRYADKPNQLTTLIGAALSARKLKPTPKHSLYSLRHSLMDRLRSVGAPENVQKDIAGHRYLYGKGTSLELRYAYQPSRRLPKYSGRTEGCPMTRAGFSGILERAFHLVHKQRVLRATACHENAQVIVHELKLLRAQRLFDGVFHAPCLARAETARNNANRCSVGCRIRP